MASPARWEEALSFTPQQRRLLLGLFTAVAIFAAVLLIRDRSTIPDPQSPRGDRWAELADRLDPNTADWTELAALPNVGEKRARAIIAQREKEHARNPNAVAFRRPNDLLKVDGIAYSMTEQLKPFLRFPDEFPTSHPSPTGGG